MTQPTPCPHCPDGHTPPTSGSQSWAVWVTDTEDGDGQPTNLMVARTGGAHVAESDAEWMRARLNGRDRADRAAVLDEAADGLSDAYFPDGLTVQNVRAHLRRMAEEARS